MQLSSIICIPHFTASGSGTSPVPGAPKTGTVSPNSPIQNPTTDAEKRDAIYIANAGGYCLEFKLVPCNEYSDIDSSKYPGWQVFYDWAKDRGVTLSSEDGYAISNYGQLQYIIQEFNSQTPNLLSTYGWSITPASSYGDGHTRLIILGKASKSNDGNSNMVIDTSSWAVQKTYNDVVGGNVPYGTPILLVRPL